MSRWRRESLLWLAYNPGAELPSQTEARLRVTVPHLDPDSVRLRLWEAVDTQQSGRGAVAVSSEVDRLLDENTAAEVLDHTS